MSFRCVAPVTASSRGWWLLWFFGRDDDERLRKALPGYGIVAADHYTTTVAPEVMASCRKLVGASLDLPLSLAGFSAGCQSVRAILLSGTPIRDVAVFDGTHAGIPPAPWQIDVWRKWLTGPGRFIATCTSMGYTERIPPGGAGRATSTRHVLEGAIGRELEVGAPYITETVHVERFASADSDKAAHVRQQNEVAPSLLSRYFAIPDDVPTVRESIPPTWLDPTLSIGQRLVAWCGGELASGVRETPLGSNDSPRIREYFTTPPFTRGSAPIRVTKTAWCAAAACMGVHSVLLPGETSPLLAYRVSGLELQQDAERRGQWAPGKMLGRRGDIAIFTRGAPGSWERHVTVVVSDDGRELVTVGGNEGPGQWQRTVHADRPIGFVRVDPVELDAA